MKYDRPWMAYIEIVSTIKFHCGGSVINKRYVLTAAHCTCDQLPCAVDQNDDLQINYEPKGKLTVYLGFKDTKKRKLKPENIYPVVEIKVHEKYRQDFHDMALLKVERDIVFGPKVAPICMPLGPKFPDTGHKGFVAGWGHVKNRQENKTTLYLRTSTYEYSLYAYDQSTNIYNTG